MTGRGRGKGDGRQAEQEPFWRRFRPAGLLSSPVCPQTLSTLPLCSSLTSLPSDPAKWEDRPAPSCLIPGDTSSLASVLGPCWGELSVLSPSVPFSKCVHSSTLKGPCPQEAHSKGLCHRGSHRCGEQLQKQGVTPGSTRH